MIVLSTHYNVFMFLPIRLKVCRSNGFFFFARQNVCARNIGRVSEILHALACSIDIGHVICLGLYHLISLVHKTSRSCRSSRLEFCLQTSDSKKCLEFVAEATMKEFNYSPLTWMCHSRTMNNTINHLHEGASAMYTVTMHDLLKNCQRKMNLSPYILEICKLLRQNVKGLQEFVTGNNSRRFPCTTK